jgi:hypothetical protein
MLLRTRSSSFPALSKDQNQRSNGSSVSFALKFNPQTSNCQQNLNCILGNENETSDQLRSIEFSEAERYKLEKHDGVEKAKLVINMAKLSDRGYFTCEGTNKYMNDTASSEGYVRVKDKLAALWPFLGICAEVFVLCAIILIYEKRRNKTDLDESDTDQSPDQ